MKKILSFCKVSREGVSKFEGKRKYIATGDIIDNCIKSFENVTYDNKPSRANQNVKIGDVLFAKMQNTVKVIIIDENNVDNIYSTGFFVITPDENVKSRFLYWLFNSEKFNKDKDKNCKGATQKALNLENLSKLEIKKLPLYNEQENIILKLDKVQKLIDLNKEQIELLNELIKDVFIDLFGNPITNTKKFSKVKLKDCIRNIENGKSFVCNNNCRNEENPAILKLSAVTYGYYNQNENKALLDEHMYISKVEVKNGDLLFTRKNTPELVGMCAYVYNTQSNLMLPDLIFRLNTLDNCNKIFLWKLINNPLFRNKVKAISNGSAKSMSNISKENLMNLEIILPPIQLQNEFEKIVNKIEKQKEKYQEQLKEAKELMNTLMNQYFN